MALPQIRLDRPLGRSALDGDTVLVYQARQVAVLEGRYHPNTKSDMSLCQEVTRWCYSTRTRLDNLHAVLEGHEMAQLSLYLGRQTAVPGGH